MQVIRESVAGHVPHSEWLSDVIKVAPDQFGKPASQFSNEELSHHLMGMNRQQRRAYMAQRRKVKK
jgi:hypothetical protein